MLHTVPGQARGVGSARLRRDLSRGEVSRRDPSRLDPSRPDLSRHVLARSALARGDVSRDLPAVLGASSALRSPVGAGRSAEAQLLAAMRDHLVEKSHGAAHRRR
jgi:hypothetical protein